MTGQAQVIPGVTIEPLLPVAYDTFTTCLSVILRRVRKTVGIGEIQLTACCGTEQQSLVQSDGEPKKRTEIQKRCHSYVTILPELPASY
jgi:hypothetical protein